MPRHTVPLLAALTGAALLPALACAQTPVRVKDINTVVPTSGGGPGQITVSGNKAFFATDDGSAGTELWITDATTAGTALVKDIRPGATGSNVQSLFSLGDGRVLFSANDGTNGAELWVSDGTEAGTTMVANINAASANSSPTSFARLNATTIVFSATTAADGAEPWKLDLTTMTPSRIRDINPGPTGSLGIIPYMTLYNGRVYFAATRPAEGVELWATDGTEAGTVLIRDVIQGPEPSLSPSHLTVSGGRLFFRGTFPLAGAFLWVYDGTDILATGAASLPSAPSLTDVGGILYYAASDSSAGTELWRSDGTTTGTFRVVDLNAGPGNAITNISGSAIANLNGQVLFVATDGGTFGTEMWTTSGAPGNATLVKDIAPGPSGSSPTNLGVAGNYLYASADNGSLGSELWRTDGVPEGAADNLHTILIRDGRPTIGSPFAPVPFMGQALFNIDDAAVGRELFVTDGTVAGTHLVKNTRPDAGPNGAAISLDLAFSSARAIAQVGQRVFFRASDGWSGEELFVTDGTEASTRLVKDIHNASISNGPLNGNPVHIVDLSGVAYFGAAGSAASNTELWRSDGTEAGTFLVKEIAPGAPTGFNGPMAVVGNRLVFAGNDASNGFEIWTSDGTEAGTAQLGEIRPGSSSSTIASFTMMGGRLYFTATPDGTTFSLYSTDATAVVQHPIPGAPTAAPTNLTAVGSTLYFRSTGNDAGGAAVGAELWKFTTSGGVELVKNINPGSASANPASFAAFNDKLYFVATDGTNGLEIYATDGTDAGTTRIDLAAGPATRSPLSLTRVGNLIFFNATNVGSSDTELFRLDPADNAFALVKAINPSTTTGSSPGAFIDYNGVAYFVANDGATGTELWKSDGSELGTVRVTDVNPAGNSSPRSLKTADTLRRSMLFFSAAASTSNPTDEELYVITLCRADYNGANGVDLLDIFAFLNHWFSANPRADFNKLNGVDLLDIFAFLNAWFAGPC